MNLTVAATFTIILFVHHFGADMPFRGLLSKHAEEAISHVDFCEIVLSWLPAWWITLAISYTMAGFAVACAVWAFVDTTLGNPIGTPLLLGAAAVITALANLCVPIITAWFKDRSENRQVDMLRARIVELETTQHVHTVQQARNSKNIDSIATVTNKIVAVTPDVSGEVEIDRPGQKDENPAGHSQPT